jgi:hypothetical protein
MRVVALVLLTACGSRVSDPIFATIDRAEVVPGEVRIETGIDDTGETGTETEDTGPFTGGCLELHGDPDHFGGSDAALPLGDAPRTVEFWFKHSNNAGTDAVVAYGASGAGFLVGFYNGFPYVLANGVSVYGASSGVADGAWHHLGAAWDPGAGQVSLWIDGVLDAQQAASVQTTGGGALWLGDDPVSPNSGDAYEGVIDEVHIWNRALQDGEFGGLYKVAPPGLVAWYTMNQEGSGAGLTLPSEVGADLDLVSAGAPAFVPCEY